MFVYFYGVVGGLGYNWHIFDIQKKTPGFFLMQPRGCDSTIKYTIVSIVPKLIKIESYERPSLN